MAGSRFARCATLAIAVAGLFSGGALEATAQDGRLIGECQTWCALTTDTPKVCWIAAQPTVPAVLPAGRFRDPTVFTVRIDAADGNKKVPGVDMGYPLAGPVTITIDGGEPFTMVTFTPDESGEKAWLRTDEEDARLLVAMLRGRSMVVAGRSTGGTNTSDTYSLVGVTAALERATRECQ